MIDYIPELLRKPAFWHGALAGLVLIASVIIARWVLSMMFQQTKKVFPSPKPGHVKPSLFNVSYSSDSRGFTSITICEQCGVRGQWHDLLPYEPCYRCGGRRRETTGRWTGTEWITADESRQQREGL